MLKAILIDDEPDSIRLLALQLKAHCPQVEIAGQYTSSMEGLQAIRSLKPDLVFLDGTDINYLPLNDAFNQIVNCENSAAVKHVMIDGRFVVKDREICTIDFAALRAEIEQTAATIKSRSSAARQAVEHIEPFIAEFVAQSRLRDIGIERHVRSVRQTP